jgi:hypothetical protein
MATLWGFVWSNYWWICAWFWFNWFQIVEFWISSWRWDLTLVLQGVECTWPGAWSSCYWLAATIAIMLYPRFARVFLPPSPPRRMAFRACMAIMSYPPGSARAFLPPFPPRRMAYRTCMGVAEGRSVPWWHGHMSFSRAPCSGSASPTSRGKFVELWV